MNLDLPTVLEAAASTIAVLGGSWSAWRHLTLGHKIRKETEKQAILDEAKAELAKVEADLNAKIKDLEIELALAKDKISQDFTHLKEVYNAEISGLAEKIENLRSDLQIQHAQMIALLTKLISK